MRDTWLSLFCRESNRGFEILSYMQNLQTGSGRVWFLQICLLSETQFSRPHHVPLFRTLVLPPQDHRINSSSLGCFGFLVGLYGLSLGNYIFPCKVDWRWSHKQTNTHICLSQS